MTVRIFNAIGRVSGNEAVTPLFLKSYIGAVAPFTGAWIETVITLTAAALFRVAPFTGAWIETLHAIRGDIQSLVAPFTGAWIETRCAAMEK